jgi:hypothetical protein
MTGIVACFRVAVPVTTCFGNKHSVYLSYILIGSLDGSCTRFFLAENQKTSLFVHKAVRLFQLLFNVNSIIAV